MPSGDIDFARAWRFGMSFHRSLIFRYSGLRPEWVREVYASLNLDSIANALNADESLL